jgi:AMP phosphorylase
MELTTTRIDIGTSRPLVLLHTEDATELGAHPLDRVQLGKQTTTTGIVKRTDELVSSGTIGVTEPLHHLEGTIDVTLAGIPGSVRYIRKKLDNIELEEDELQTIVRDINTNRLSDVELSAYVSAVYTNGLSLGETKHLTEAMSDVGQQLSWDTPVVADKHSIGGIAGNCVTPIIVSIITAAGLTMPKTSSRAVTSPAGTADVMDVLCDVEFSIEKITEIVSETNGCIVWGGGVDLSPVDDEIIRAENPLSMDPPGQLIASVLSKKKSAGSTHLIVDIPYGEGAKVGSLDAARELADDFKRVGAYLHIDLTCALTRGTRPIGRGIGPTLEARDVLAVLEGDGPQSLRMKALQLADILLEHCGVETSAVDILESGEALEQFQRIVAAQGGDGDIESSAIEWGSETATVHADSNGIVTRIDNRQICHLARRAGAPRDSRAGLVIHPTNRETIEVGDPLYTIYAEQQSKLDKANSLADHLDPVRVQSEGDELVERR